MFNAKQKETFELELQGKKTHKYYEKTDHYTLTETSTVFRSSGAPFTTGTSELTFVSWSIKKFSITFYSATKEN